VHYHANGPLQTSISRDILLSDVASEPRRGHVSCECLIRGRPNWDWFRIPYGLWRGRNPDTGPVPAFIAPHPREAKTHESARSRLSATMLPIYGANFLAYIGPGIHRSGGARHSLAVSVHSSTPATDSFTPEQQPHHLRPAPSAPGVTAASKHRLTTPYACPRLLGLLVRTQLTENRCAVLLRAPARLHGRCSHSNDRCSGRNALDGAGIGVIGAMRPKVESQTYLPNREGPSLAQSRRLNGAFGVNREYKVKDPAGR